MNDRDSLLSDEELTRLSERGRALYNETLKAILEPELAGQIVAIHLDSGDYEVAKTSRQAHFALRDRHPEGMIMITDVGPAKMDSLTYRTLASQISAGRQK